MTWCCFVTPVTPKRAEIMIYRFNVISLFLAPFLFFKGGQRLTRFSAGTIIFCLFFVNSIAAQPGYDTLLWASPYSASEILHARIKKLRILEAGSESVNCPSCRDNEVKVRFVKRKTSLRFDHKGYPIQYRQKGKFVDREKARIANSYNSSGSLVRSDCYSRSGFLAKPYHRWVILQYDSQGRIEQMQWYYGDSIAWCRRLYEYDLNGRIIKDEFFQPGVSAPGTPTSVKHFVYDTAGRVVSETELKVINLARNETKESSLKYVYNKNGDLSERQHYIDGKLVQKFLFSYDSAGWVIMLDTTSQQPLNSTWSKYSCFQKYDQNKRLIRELTVNYTTYATLISLSDFNRYGLLECNTTTLITPGLQFSPDQSEIIRQSLEGRGKRKTKKIRYKFYNPHDKFTESKR